MIKINTKEAINFLIGCKYPKNEGSTIYKKLNKDINKIIKLLQCGEKYEAMWKEVVESSYSYDDWESLDLDELKEKYFPKDEIVK